MYGKSEKNVEKGRNERMFLKRFWNACKKRKNSVKYGKMSGDGRQMMKGEWIASGGNCNGLAVGGFIIKSSAKIEIICLISNSGTHKINSFIFILGDKTIAYSSKLHIEYVKKG